ncbi:MAG: hypothetical protein F4052_03335 [Dehalococcoidia bacterium]|nr:hypothetical protein [Dehalococcoidia bacterium]MYK25972.1 hypothetical protein [Dehalococcoidia bacterium]
MGALIDHLKSLSAEGASIEDVTAAAEEALAGGALLTSELEDPEGAIAGAAVEAEALHQNVQGAIQRFPASQSAGFHRTDLDPRAMAVVATMAYARRGGVYLPKDLEEMVADGRVSEEWHARESVRIRVLLTILPMFVAAIERGELIPATFAVGITEVAQRLGRVRIPQVAAT